MPTRPLVRVRRRAWRRVLGTSVGTLTALALVLPGGVANAAEGDPATGFTMVQANIKSGEPLGRLRSDVATVLAQDPDFVTYNEVPMRRDDALAPAGYDIWRTPGQYTGAAPVVWNAARWSPLAHGTYQVNSYQGIPKGRHTKLGLRYANWVTLQGTDGRVVSVVAVHLPPQVSGLPADLIRKGVARLGELVETLSAQGPVLVGGDFNVHYRSAKYPRDLLSAAGLVPSYDTLGSMPTGDHRGATIDYVFARSLDQSTPTSQQTHELYSDHDALEVRHEWTTTAPVVGAVVVKNAPDGTEREQRAVVRRLVRTIEAAPTGAGLNVVTGGLTLDRVRRALTLADARGVTVRFVTRSHRLSDQEQRLRDRLDRRGTRSIFYRCRTTCARGWEAARRPTTQLVVIPPDDTDGLRVDVDRGISPRAIVHSTTATIMDDKGSVDAALTQFPRAALRVAERTPGPGLMRGVVL